MTGSPGVVSSRTGGVTARVDTDRIGRPVDRLGVLAAATGLVTTAGMIATPLVPRGGAARRVLSSVVVIGLAATTKSNTARRWGLRRAGVAAGAIAATTAVVERVGTRTAVPFGRYEYTGVLRPQIGGVPAIVPLAWFAMAVPAREAAHAALGPQSTPTARVLLGAGALAAWDLFLDPQMVGEGYWRWIGRGVYRGIPATNFLGWFLTGIGVMLILERTLPVNADSGPSAGSASPALVGEYAFMAVMETVGFARYFRDPVVAAVGGVAMLPVAIVAVARGLAR